MPGVWETEAEWHRLKRELDAWHQHRQRADGEGLHRSQLETAHTLLDRALAELHAPIAALAGDPARSLAQCRVHDRRLVWLRRVFDFFRQRFDQRDEPTLGPVLRAADEVVWSCHREPLAASSRGVGAVEPPPLAYVEPGLTPEVFPHGLVPAALRRDVDAAFLRASLESLPFAVVRVPASCASAPWWLAHLGHEVGHVIDERFLGYAARSALVAGLHLDTAAAARWTQWSGEVFADLYAALMLGPWALWALAMAETQDEPTMCEPRDGYPAPVVRLLLVTHACEALGCALAAVQDEVTRWKAIVAPRPELLAEVRVGARVVDALLGHPVHGQAWTALTAHDASRWKTSSLQAWTTRLAQRPARVTGKVKRAWAREVVAAGVLRRKTGEALGRGFDGEGLASDLLAWLPAVREPGTRATAASAGPAAARHGVALARQLMEAEPLS
jgi:hypothetical protein